MDEKEVLGIIQELVCYVLGDDEIALTEATVLQNDIEGWSSLALAQVLTAIEKEFSMHFSLNDIISINTVGDIIHAINSVKRD